MSSELRDIDTRFKLTGLVADQWREDVEIITHALGYMSISKVSAMAVHVLAEKLRGHEWLYNLGNKLTERN